MAYAEAFLIGFPNGNYFVQIGELFRKMWLSPDSFYDIVIFVIRRSFGLEVLAYRQDFSDFV